jgi:hypothetical protein
MSSVDLHQADAAYSPFPPFSRWAGLRVDTDRWERYVQQLQEVRTHDPETLKRALEIVRRAAAIETGAIEGLYNVDRGFTLTVATQAAMWELVFAEKDPQAQALIRAQIEVYEQP